MGAGGFGSYITGMGYQAYLNLGGAPRGSPGFDASAVYDPLPSKTMPYLVLTTVLVGGTAALLKGGTLQNDFIGAVGLCGCGGGQKSLENH